MKSGTLVASKYRLVNRLGQGGMGSVWSAVHLQTGRDLAIKFLHPLVASENEDARQRFIMEARISSRVTHPNIIDVFDAGETDDGTLFLVMELLDGMSLADAIRADPPITARELLLVIGAVATALAAAHANGIIHRDIKPPNIYLHRERGSTRVRPKLLDFGVSKVLYGDEGVATYTGSLLGSPRYMAPEQAVSAARADSRSDIWSFGVILFEAFTGEFPHDGDSSNSLVIAIATKPPKSIHRYAPHLPTGLRKLIEDCLRIPDERIGGAQAFIVRLREVLDTTDLDSVEVLLPTRLKKRIARQGEFLIDPAIFLPPEPQELEAQPTVPRMDVVAEYPIISSPSSGDEATLVQSVPGLMAAAPAPAPPDAAVASPRSSSAEYRGLKRTLPLGTQLLPSSKPTSVPPVTGVDPADSVSSIVRGVAGHTNDFAARTPSGHPARPRSRKAFAMVIGGVGVAALATTAILVASSQDPPASPPKANAGVVTSIVSGSAAPPLAVETAGAVTVAPVTATASSPTKSSSAPVATVSNRPSTTAPARSAPVRTGRPVKTSNDPLDKLGSGIGKKP